MVKATMKTTKQVSASTKKALGSRKHLEAPKVEVHAGQDKWEAAAAVHAAADPFKRRA